MLTIRLSRVGKKKQPSYRLIVSENARDPWGKALEFLGDYNPRTNPSTVNLKTERIKYWISKGAQTSTTVHNLLINKKVIEGSKIKADSTKKKKEEKK
ncbi:MAG: 30S ribosomal protein S16 [Patescibacteria group bacterium]